MPRISNVTNFKRLQFLDLTDATENDQSLIERVLFSSSQVLEVPWCTGSSDVVEDQPAQEWANSYGDVEPRQDLQGSRVQPSLARDREKDGERCGREGPEDGGQGEHQEQSPQQDQLPRQGGVFPGHPPTSMPHQPQPVFQMYQMVPSLSNVYVSNVTANVNVHAPYVPPIPAHYGHQMPPQQQQQQQPPPPPPQQPQQQQQPPPQQLYSHGAPEGEQGNRNRRARQKTDKKREGPFVQASEVMSPSLEGHPPPQFPNIHPMQPYYIPGAPGGPVYMQHAVLPVYPSPMFNPYGHSPIVYPQTNNIEPGNEAEYHDTVQQNFHQSGPELVVVGCGVRQESASERGGADDRENGYPAAQQQQQQPDHPSRDPSGFKPVSGNVQFDAESAAENQSAGAFAARQNGERFDKSGGKGGAALPANGFHDRKEKAPEAEKPGSAAEASFRPAGGDQARPPHSHTRKTDAARFDSDAAESPNKANCEAGVNNVDNVSVNSNSGAAGWLGDDAGGRGAALASDASKLKINNAANGQLAKVPVPVPVPVSQNSEFPLIGQNAKSSPEPEAKPQSPGVHQPTSASAGKSWASLFNRSDQQRRPLARVLPYHEADPGQSPSSPASGGPPHPCPAPCGAKPERVPSVKSNGPLSKDTVPNSIFVNDPFLHNLGEFLCSYELEHKIVSLQPRGLTNRSNWCYVNAILQSLIACPPFYNLLKALPVGVNRKGTKQTMIMDALVEYANEFSLLPANARIGKREKSARNKEESSAVEIVAGPAFEPSGIYKVLDKVRGESSFNVEGRQEDAEEFLSCLLNGLNDEMFELMKMVDSNKLGLSNGDANGSLEGNAEDDESEWNVMGPKNKSSVTRRAVCGKTPISDIFRGQFRSRVQRAGDQSTDTVQPFFTLQLDIEKASSVKDALELFMGRDPLEGVTCSRTHQEVEAWTQTTLEDLPLVLILHLKCYDYKSDACSKIIKSVDFQVDLKIDAKLLSNRNKYTGKQRNYKLVAVVYHDGKEASKGHYVTDAYHVGYGCWLRYDDVVVRSVPESHVLSPRPPRVPYLLYYRRADTIGPTK